jgi:hypothetical protein
MSHERIGCNMSERNQVRDGKNKRGPEPDRVKIEGDWEDVIKKALKKGRPKEKWSKPENKSK